VLETSALSAGYGPVSVLHGVSLVVGQGELVAVLGSNGAGKTTLFKSLFGFTDVTGGEITFEGLDLRTTKPFRAARAGLVHVPEGRGLFAGLSVVENLRTPAYAQGRRHDHEEDLEMVFGVFPQLRDRREQVAGTMSGGEQQMLAIARGLMARPRMLLLDEPSIGLAPKLVDDVFEALRHIHDTRPDMALLIVEQSVADTLDLCDRGYLLERGEVVRAGTSAELGESTEVEDAFLGTVRPS